MHKMKLIVHVEVIQLGHSILLELLISQKVAWIQENHNL